jgi:hypothetical protein
MGIAHHRVFTSPGGTMNSDSDSGTPAASLTPQQMQRNQADLHERAFQHHREAARLYECGDWRHAELHAGIARGHAVAALELEHMPVFPTPV